MLLPLNAPHVVACPDAYDLTVLPLVRRLTESNLKPSARCPGRSESATQVVDIYQVWHYCELRQECRLHSAIYPRHPALHVPHLHLSANSTKQSFEVTGSAESGLQQRTRLPTLATQMPIYLVLMCIQTPLWAFNLFLIRGIQKNMFPRTWRFVNAINSSLLHAVKNGATLN